MKKKTVKKNWDNPVEHPMPAGVRVPAAFHIGAVRVAPATVLAPMAGVTDTVFRRFIRNASVFSTAPVAAPDNDSRQRLGWKGAGLSPSINPAELSRALAPEGTSLRTDPLHQPNPATAEAAIDTPVSNLQSGCGLIMTEFTSADGLARSRESKRKRYLTFYEDEHPIAAQLFGSNPDTLAEAARIVEATGFDIVDLNLGCPSKRVVGCNGGSGLLRDLPLVAKIFETVRAAVSIPFTVKFRLGWSDNDIVCVDLARIAEQSGLNAVALHARTREQGYTGQARWEYIAAVKQAVSIPVIGNGDIRTPEDACALIAQTGCDAVMIGRAAPANPWIFRQIAQYTATGHYDEPTEADRYHLIRTYFQMLVGEGTAGEETAIEDASLAPSSGDKLREHRECQGKMKQFASWFTHGIPGGAALRKSIYECKTGAAILAAVDDFFEPRLSSVSAAAETLVGELIAP